MGRSSTPSRFAIIVREAIHLIRSYARTARRNCSRSNVTIANYEGVHLPSSCCLDWHTQTDTVHLCSLTHILWLKNTFVVQNLVVPVILPSTFVEDAAPAAAIVIMRTKKITSRAHTIYVWLNYVLTPATGFPGRERYRSGGQKFITYWNQILKFVDSTRIFH